MDIEVLLKYHDLGLSLIPLKENSKSPAITWKKFQSKRADKEQLRAWAKNKSANYNFGIVTGIVSGLVVVDADSDEAVAWCNENLPHTPMRTKTAKGAHLYYRHSGGRIPNGVKLKGMALDVRGDGGEAVAPGSIHPTGITYEQVGDWSSLDNIPYFDPNWISSEANDKRSASVRPEITNDDMIHRFIKNAPNSTEGDNGSAKLMSVIGQLINKFHLTRGQALPYISEYNRLHATPQWSDDELSHALDSAEKSHRSNSKKNDFRHNLITDSKGNILPFQANVENLLINHPDLADSISMCEFSHQIIIKRQMPWGGAIGSPWNDWHEVELKSWIERSFLWSPNDNIIRGALLAVAHRNPTHPVREYLRNLVWDGACRLNEWATVYLGTTKNAYTRMVGRKWLIQAIARIFRPGCKAELVITLEGKQGIRKSSAIRALMPNPEWFEDGLPDITNKDALMAMNGKWFIEFQEFHGLSKAGEKAAKSFISIREDTYRVPYGHHVQTVKRQCVFVGSTNEKAYLQDPSGNRRHLPLECTSIDIPGLVRDRDQLWAEAFHEYKEGEPWHLNEEESELAKESQDTRRIEDPWEATIEEFLKHKSDVTISEVMISCLKLPHQNCKSSESYRVSNILSNVFGWSKTKVVRGTPGSRVNGFEPNPVRPY